jgi:uncharacterized protein YcnI
MRIPTMSQPTAPVSSLRSSFRMLGCFRGARSRNTLAAGAAALALAAPAAAHVDASPTGIPAGGNETISLDAHNDRDVAMDELVLTVPAGFTITDALDAGDWDGSFEERVATWTGGALAGDASETFELDLAGPDEPGPATLELEQRYPDGGVVRSQVALTVVPADESEDTALFVLVIVGLLLAGSGVAVAFTRWRATSQR